MMGPLAIHQLGRMLAAKGRGSDRHLVHVSDAELKKLREWSGAGQINPHTGLMEFDADSGGSDGGAGGSGAGGSGAGGDGGDGTASGSFGGEAGTSNASDSSSLGGETGGSTVGGSMGGSPGASNASDASSIGAMDDGVSTDAGMAAVAALGNVANATTLGPESQEGIGTVSGTMAASPGVSNTSNATTLGQAQNSMGFAQFDMSNMPGFAAHAIGMALGIFGGIPGTIAAIGAEPAMDAALGKNPATTESLAQEAIAASPFGLAIDAARGINYGVDALGLSPPGTANPDAATSGLGSLFGPDTSLDPNQAASLASSPATTTPTNTYLARGTL